MRAPHQRVLLVFSTLAVSFACSSARTEVLIVVDTDLGVPDEIDQIRVDLIGPNGETRRSEGALRDVEDLPRTLGVVDTTHTARTVRATVTGLRGGANVIQRRAVFQLVPRETRILRLDLLRSCVGVSCAAEETCAENGCRPIEITPQELVPYDPELVQRFDGGVQDGGADGGCIVVKEVCNERDDDCDGEVDEDFDRTSDVDHCGACANACPSEPDNAASVCVGGECELRCDPDTADCNGDAADGCEADLGTPTTCGDCDVTCGSSAPYCTKLDTGLGCVAACAEGTTDCGGSCVDLSSDPRHCGGCGVRCIAPPNAVATCMAGECSFECDEDYADCDGDAANGCESMLRELEHCGRCGQRCERPGALTSCATGRCEVLGCLPLFGDCDGDEANGCEEDLSSNLARCGACDNACPTGLDHGTVSCNAGRCELACHPGFGNCDASITTGCEVALSSPAACGACGVSCSDPTPFCQFIEGGYVCTERCVSGVPCGQSCVRTESDPLHCGGCGIACSTAPNAVSTCAGGRCALTCSSGFADCDENMDNGCETPTDGNVANCGGCGIVCPVPANGSATCTDGVCGIRCDPGYADCNGMASDGCETSLLTDAEHCGTCGNRCVASGTITAVACDAGACEILACVAPHGDCDGVYANGCEIDTDANRDHCGGCGDACNPGRRCCGGECRRNSECH